MERSNHTKSRQQGLQLLLSVLAFIENTVSMLTMPPICATPSHVQALHSCPLPTIVFVVDIRKCRIMLGRTIITKASTRGREIPRFKFRKEAWLCIRVV